ncbi:MAG: ferritin-like domain-containing protein [Planctomycetes bacterium]|nr:ferritin-like domain-containing protein [Planctomycetota bacterium]MBM3992316.1 ferritin-like domain-containing protein [Planctomycetota bacterium]
MRRSLALAGLGFDRGAGVLLARELRRAQPGDELEITGSARELGLHLAAWARAGGHALVEGRGGWALRFGPSTQARRRGAQRAGAPEPSSVAEHARPCWGLAARGALVEAGGQALGFRLDRAEEIWFSSAAELYRAAAAAQWDPSADIPWDAPLEHPDEVEDALVCVLTFLIENETAALLVPARFATQVHPHFREVVQLLALQAAEEARHIEVFSRRAALRRGELGLSTVGGQASLRTLVEEPDFARAALLLSVLGEGTFLNLLAFLREHAPDAASAEIMRRVAIDEARHVAFAMAHLGEHARADATLRARLAAAITQRHEALRASAGLNEEVFDALVLLAAGSFDPEAIAQGHARVQELLGQMDAGRRLRLRKLGFDEREAAELSGLHTRNFM